MAKGSFMASGKTEHPPIPIFDGVLSTWIELSSTAFLKSGGPYRFITGNKYSTLVKDVDSRGSYASVKGGVHGNSPSFLLNFAVP